MKTQTLTDYELVQEFVNGKQSSIEILIKRHKNKVFTYIYLVVKNRALAEDILQDTFIKVIKSLSMGKYQDNGKFVSWVMRIAHNLIIDHFRKEKQSNTFLNDNFETKTFNTSKFADSTIEDEIIDVQTLDEVKTLVHLLPEDQKQVINMRFYEGLSFKEIADQTEVSINTALGRMRYALINLRKIIEEKKLNLSRI